MAVTHGAEAPSTTLAGPLFGRCYVANKHGGPLGGHGKTARQRVPGVVLQKHEAGKRPIETTLTPGQPEAQVRAATLSCTSRHWLNFLTSGIKAPYARDCALATVRTDAKGGAQGQALGPVQRIATGNLNASGKKISRVIAAPKAADGEAALVAE